MHLERTGREAEVREVYDTQECGGCHGLLAYPHVHIGTLNCDCAGTGSHRTRTCRQCGTVNYEPAHEGEASTAPNGGSRLNRL